MEQDPYSKLIGRILVRLRDNGSFESIFAMAGNILKKEKDICPLLFIDIPSDPGGLCQVFEAVTGQVTSFDRNLPVLLWDDLINSSKPFLFSLETPADGSAFWRSFSLPSQPKGWVYPVTANSRVTGYVVFIFTRLNELPPLKEMFSIANCIAIAYSRKDLTPHRHYDELFVGGKIVRVTWEFREGGVLYVQDISSNCNAIGYQYSEIIGTNFADIVHFDDVEVIKEKFNACQSGESFWEGRYRIVAPNGNILWLYSYAKVDEAQGQVPFYISGLLVDVSDEMSAREGLKASLQNLEWFAHAASHDLKEPTNTIVGRLRMVERALVQAAQSLTALEKQVTPHVVTSPEFQDLKRLLKSTESSSIIYPVVRALKGAKRLSELIDGLLQYSRVSRQKQEVKCFPSDDVISEVIDGLSEEISRTGAVVEILTPLPRVCCDRGLFILVIQNLIENSLKFRKPDRSPCIYISCRTEAVGARSALTASNLKCFSWKFTIADNGIGFDSVKFQQKVFQPFTRLHPPEQFPGTGIGLASCYKIVALWKGRIVAESTPGKGASFSFTVPAE
jgi:PAS domain S-box-containing protein